MGVLVYYSFIVLLVSRVKMEGEGQVVDENVVTGLLEKEPLFFLFF